MPKTKPPYPEAFKLQMVELAMAGRTPGELAREFDVSAQSISAWVARAAADAGKPVRNKDVLSSTEREELARLRRQVRQLQQERDILAKGYGLIRRPGRQDAWSTSGTGAIARSEESARTGSWWPSTPKRCRANRWDRIRQDPGRSWVLLLLPWRLQTRLLTSRAQLGTEQSMTNRVTLRSAIMVLGLLATTWAHGSLCFTLVNARGAVVSHSSTSPVDLSYAISDELRRKFPGHHLIFAEDKDCPALAGAPYAVADVGVGSSARPSGTQGRSQTRAPRSSRN